MADQSRQRIHNLLCKMNDDRNQLCCLLVKSGYAVRVGKERPGGKGQKLSFSGIRWKEDVQLGFAKRGEAYEPV